MNEPMNPSSGPGQHQEEQRDDTREVDTVAATIDVEFESGVYTDPIRRHRGYYAGDFSQLARPADSD